MPPAIQICPYRCSEALDNCQRDEQGRLICRATGRAPNSVKSVLYFAPSKEHLGDLLKALGSLPDCTVLDTPAGPAFKHQELVLHFVGEWTVQGVLDRLHKGYYNLVLLDLRSLTGCDETAENNLAAGAALLKHMDEEEDVENRYAFHRVLALLSSCDDYRADRRIAELARLGVSTVLRDRTKRPAEGDSAVEVAAFGSVLLGEMREKLTPRRKGRRALCASGGGITGIYFEMGVLKCLDDCLDTGTQGLFDLYYGISAGAVVTGLLANGYTIDEMMASMAGHPGGRIPPLSLSLLRLSNVNVGDLRDRVLGAAKYVVQQLFNQQRPEGTLSPEMLVLQAGDLFGPPLRGEGFEKKLRELFSQPGTTNDFRRLRAPLYVGATDQDTRQHVLFGQGDKAEAPISLAIQASFSINPAFTSTRVLGRYYEDGAVSQTSNFDDAVRDGADFVVVVDPFVPYVSKAPGFARRRGILYNADQDLRTLSFTRFRQVRDAILKQNSWVSSYTFLPANRLRRLLSVNPMDHRPFLAIWRAAYLSTLQRVQALQHRLCGDLAIHGVQLDTTKADLVAAQLQRTETPALADFFPDRTIELRAPKAAAPPVQLRSAGGEELALPSLSAK